MSDERTPSIWKREISFKRKPSGEEAEPTTRGTTPEGDETPGEATLRGANPGGSVWKKEISLHRKGKQTAPEEVATAVEATPAGTPEPEQAPAPTPVLPVTPALADVEPVLPAAEAPAVPDLPVADAPTDAEVDHSWLTQPLEEVSEPGPVAVDRPPTPAAAALELVDTPAVLPTELDPALVFAPEDLPAAPTADARPDPVLADLPDLPDLPDFSSLPGLSELVPRAEAPPAETAVVTVAAAAPEAKVPFYKRELSLGKQKAAKAPKAPKAEKVKEPKAEKPKQARTPKAASGWDETDVKKPFYKRELSFGKKTTKTEPAEAPTAVAVATDLPAKAPKERRSLSLPSFSAPSRPKALDAKGGKGAKKLVGLKIGASQLAAARISNGDTPELLQAVREPLDPGIVVGGELRDPEALAVALRDFFKKHGLPKRGVRLGIANNRIGVRTFEVTGIDDDKQLANAIRFRAQEVLPIPIEEAVLDYQVLSDTVDEEGNRTRRVLLVVAYRELVDRYLFACRKAGIQIVGIDLEAFALLRAIAEPHDPVEGSDRGALVAVSVGHERSTFAVSDGRTCEFTRVLEWGGWAVNVAIARALDLAPSEAEPLKRALSFAGADTAPDGFTQEQLDTARDAARRQLQSFARELVSSLQFYQNQPGSLGIGEIVVTGGSAHLPGFGAELERLIGVPVRVGDPMARLKVSKKVRDREQIGSLAIAIGLGIED